MILFVVGAALLHVVAVVLALRLIKLTGKRAAWILISVAILFQAVRRFIAFAEMMSGSSVPLDPLDDFLAFAISLLMLVGLALIGPLFQAIKRSEEVLRDASKNAAEEAAEREKLLSELQHALTNIKELKGIIPICSYCKKVRDDEGYWHMVEAYVSAHSDAEFSHGICPNCLEQVRTSFKNEAENP